ncbi:hypothetical protein [Rodentibacter trehalosifermentans]|nr:hypothetical protein [Rodentibacter trehalosifermentans]
MAKHQCGQKFHSFCEYVTYWHGKEYWENEDDPIVVGLRLVFGQYLKKGAYRKGIPIWDYAQCLSTDFSWGRLKPARVSGYLPPYSRRMAKKYGVEKGCGGTGGDGSTYRFE